MRKLIFFFMLLLPVSLSAKEIQVEVKGMHCGGCEGLVEEALESVHGVTSVKADAKAGKAVVHMSDDAVVDENVIKKAVSTAGKRYSAGKITPVAAE